MGNELVSDSLTPNGGESEGSTAFSYTKVFEEHLPYYLSIGMPYELYWRGDCTLVKAYRKADEMRKKRKNEELWLQGLYVYEAICNASPILHAFAKKGTTALPYPTEPYPITEADAKQREEDKDKRKFENNKEKMRAWAAAVNKQFQIKREEENDG